MSTSSLGVSSSTSAPITISGLASGLETSKIISALMGVEREPVTHLSDQQARLAAQQTGLLSIQGELQQLSFAAAEFAVPSQFESSQTVTSSEPGRVEGVVTGGAPVGGYEVEVTQLANSAQRTFTFASPTGEGAVTIDGQQFKLQAGESAKALASAINASGTAKVYAAVLANGSMVLSNRETGSTGGEFIEVSGAALTEVAGTAKEGKDAEFTIDGEKGTSSSNTVTEAIAGVTLTLGGLTTTTGPVTLDIQPPSVSTAAIESQMQSFIKLYNSTVSAIETQLTTKSPSRPQSTSEFATGTLFGDQELSSLLDSMRVSMYEPIAGLAGEMSSPYSIGLSTGSPTAGVSSQSSLEGQLTLDPAKLAEAIKSNPAGVKQMLEQWSGKLQTLVNDAAGPGGTIEARISGDGEQVTQLTSRINDMDELLSQREKALQATYAALEGVISRNTAQSDWLTQQSEALAKSGG